MRWISNSKSIPDMEKNHIERKAELKALVDSLFEEERPTSRLVDQNWFNAGLRGSDGAAQMQGQAIYGSLLGQANASSLAQAQAANWQSQAGMSAAQGQQLSNSQTHGALAALMGGLY